MDEQTPRDRIRAADVDRERAAERLRVAHAEGRLDLAEFDERVQQVWAARTYGELDQLTADLPTGRGQPVQHRPQPVPPAGQDSGPPEHRSSHRGSAAWLAASVLNLVIWAMVCLTTWSWIYPWWIWVAGPWGAVLLMRWATEGQRKPPH